LLKVKLQQGETKMSELKRARYTLEFKLEAVRLVKAGQSLAAVSAILSVPAQTMSNWVKAERNGTLGGAGEKPVSPEQMELARLRAEVSRLKMERDLLKKWAAYFAKEST
jgi:transposase